MFESNTPIHPTTVEAWQQRFCGIQGREHYAGVALPALITAMLSRRNEADFADFDKAAIVEAARLSVVAADAILNALAERDDGHDAQMG